MQTNSKTASTVASVIKSHARDLASLPNRFAMCDARALAFADVATALELCAIYLDGFIGTNAMAAGRKYLPLATKTSEALSLLAGADESPVVGRCILSASSALVKAHSAFQEHANDLLSVHSATATA